MTVGDTDDIDDTDDTGDIEERYDDGYYRRRLAGTWYHEGRAIARELYTEFEPECVIDLGCAVGVYLEYMAEQGATVHGVDAHPAAIRYAAIESISQWDLRDPYYPPRTDYDLVLCIEVAEHLAERFADTLVESVTRCGSPVVFTAAQPGQDGTHHVNCQPREYWRTKFDRVGYRYDAAAVDRVRRSIVPTRLDWVPRNLFVFRQRDQAGGADV